MNRHVGSEDCFRLANQWLEECYTSHVAQGTCPPPRDHPFVPSRLVETRFEGNTFQPRVVEPSKNERIRWACLSYCWGDHQPTVTTNATLLQHKSGFSFEGLPKTFQDAITVTHQLGLRFLWIDSLCIIQDDPEDVANEISKMPDIYKHAYVTISASVASGCRDGFLQDRPWQQPVAIPCRCEGGMMGTAFFTDQSTDGSLYDPVHFRAWTLQERILSPRFLDYSSMHLR